MKKALIFAALVLFSLAINVLQSSLFFPLIDNRYVPDLNLILVIYISISRNLPFGILIVILNGYLADMSSGYAIGFNTFSRLSLFVILKRVTDYFDFEDVLSKLLALSLGTVYVWFFVWLVVLVQLADGFNISAGIILTQVISNSLVGVLAFELFDRINARIQK